MLTSRLLLIVLGGAVGTLARYGAGAAVAWAAPGLRFPVATLLVNCGGCLAMGLLQGLFLTRWPVREEIRLALLVGLLGGFTTFSSFAWDALALSRAPRGLLLSGAYVLLTNMLGLGLAWLAFRAVAEAQ